MGNKLSCSCAPLIRKAYRYEDSPWQATRRRDGHLLRLWAEVFHVSAQGNVKWQQVSEDLVPVNITCIQDTPECVFHITAYNSQVDKILDVRLVQPGTRLGQASECFVYWKDPATGDTWGLNFTSPIDAKQFRECCSPSFKFSRKASSSYSLKLEPPKNKMKGGKRKPVSTPSSPSRLQREPQCTCMTRENLHNLQRMRTEASRGGRITGAATLPRTQQGRLDESHQLEGGISTAVRRERMFTAPSSASVYDNVGNSLRRGVAATSGGNATSGSTGQTSGDVGSAAAAGGGVSSVVGGVKQTRSEGSLKSFPSTPDDVGQRCPPGGGQGGGGDSIMINSTTDKRDTARSRAALRKEAAKSIDYSEMESIREAPIQKMDGGGQMGHRRTKSKSSDDVFEQVLLAASGGRAGHRGGSGGGNSVRSLAGLIGLSAQSSGDMSTLSLDSNALKRMLQPMTSTESAGDESPSERAMSYHGGMQVHPFGAGRSGRSRKSFSRMTSSRSSSIQDYDRKSNYTHSDSFRSSIDQQSMYTLDQEDDDDRSPPSDNVLFDNQCYATTPSSSNGEGGYGGSGHGGSHRRRRDVDEDDDADYEGDGQQHHQQQHQLQQRRGRGGRGRRRGHLPVTGLPNSPTSRLLMEYETHLRNTLARGLDAESYSLHTFEALLTQSMENLESIVWSGVRAIDHDEDGNNKTDDRRRSSQPSSEAKKKDFVREIKRIHRRFQSLPPLSGSPPMGKSSTLPLTHSKSAGMHFSAASLAAAAAAHHRGDYGGSSLHSMHRSGGHEHSFVQQASLESADSRLCYLTSSEISDDERMSLTTAISDEDDVESTHNSPYKSRISVVAESTFNCTGAVRKAGFLSVKKWLLRKKHQVELARKRGWKGYWVCLKGTTLLFYPCDNPREGRSIENTPKHLIIVDGAIMQPIPEHPKREYIFCLSTAFGDAYLFQAPCQVELENWVNGIHSACAAAFARHRGKTGTLHLLQEEIYRLEKEIESDSKMRHMADLQLTVVSDVESRQTLLNQIGQWEENLERLQCEQFRIRCYMASLQNTELPNPKNLLAHVSRGTKNTLNRLGVFTVSSFHAYVSACSPSLLNNLLAGRGATKRRQSAILSRSNSASSRRSLNLSTGGTQDLPSLTEKPLKVILPDSRSATIYVRDTMSAEELLAVSCGKRQLIPTDHFLRLFRSKDDPDDYFVPHRTDLVENLSYVGVEVCAKILYQVELSRSTPDQMWGFSVEAELVETNERNDELCVTVSRVEDKSLAMQQGIIKGDEIMVINGAIVSDLDMMYIESVLQEELSLCAMMRSCRTEPPEFTGAMKTTDDYIEQLVCPPPPSDPPALSDEMISGLIVPAPAWNQERLLGRKMRSMSSMEQEAPNTSSEQIETLLKSAEQVTSEYCRSPLPMADPQRRTSSPPPPSSVNFGRHMTDAEKLRKVILELVDTERTYVKHLNNLLEYYLEPLKKETFLSNAEINALFGNIQEIVAFQRVFQQSLEDAVHQAEPEFHRFDNIYQFKSVLFSLGGSFRYYANHFKLYSSFCASHSKAQKVLHPNEGNQSLQNFLQARNPKQQHSSTLESYLIKPIQRILKYPLLLQQLKNLTDPDSDEHLHLAEALKGMEKVAEHINEMQRIHEEYGAIFDHLFRQHTRVCKQWGPVLGQHVDLSPGELLYYGGVEWLNISDFLGKIKKGLELHAMCFVFKTAVVFLCKERIRQKKKLMGGSSKANAPEVEIIRYQVLIPVTEVQVRASSIRDVDSHFMWELIHLRSHVHRRSEKTYHLSNSTGEFRNAFLKTIRQIIRESVRNMSIPANKPGASSSSMPTDRGAKSMNDRYATPTTGSGTPSVAAAVAVAAALRNARGASATTSAVDSMTRTLSNKKKSLKVPQRHSAGNIVNGASSETYDNAVDDPDNDDEDVRRHEEHLMRMRSGSSRETTMSEEDDLDGCDLRLMDEADAITAGTTRTMMLASENSCEDAGHGGLHGHQRDFKRHGKPMLGRTPNHLSLSTTSTLSTGSTGSTAAKLIQASNTPSNYQPPSKDPPAGSPVWKPRDGPTTSQQQLQQQQQTDKSPLLTVAQSSVYSPSSSENNSINAPNNRSSQQQYFVYDEYSPQGGAGDRAGVNRTPPTSANKDRYTPGKRVDC